MKQDIFDEFIFQMKMDKLTVKFHRLDNRLDI